MTRKIARHDILVRYDGAAANDFEAKLHETQKNLAEAGHHLNGGTPFERHIRGANQFLERALAYKA